MLKILNTQTKSISAASFILGVAFLLSAFLGLLRDRILANSFGASRELDIYYVAFKIPDLLATIFIFGAITAAIIPVFSRYLVKSSQDAWKFAANLLNIFIIFLIPLCGVLIFLSPFLIELVAPGFEAEQKILSSSLLRIMFLSPLILGLSHIVSAILQVFKRFLVTAIAPLLYNLGIIIGALFFSPKIGIAGVAWGVVLGAFLHLSIQLPSFFASGFKLRKVIDFRQQGFREVIKLMAPRSLGLAAAQINLIVITALASSLIYGAIAVFNLASNLAGAFINLISISVATAIFPLLSLAFAEDKKEIFVANLSSVARALIFFLTPLSFLVFFLREPSVKIIFGGGNFGPLDIQLTAACLGIFCLSFLTQGLTLFFLKAFYASHNTKIPALVSVIAVSFNIILGFLLTRVAGPGHFVFSFLGGLTGVTQESARVILGLPLAFSLANFLQFCLLAFLLYRRIGDYKIDSLLRAGWKSFFASAVMFSVIYLFSFSAPGNWLFQAFSAGLLGVFVYLFVCWVLRSSELAMVKNSLVKRFKSLKHYG